MSVDTGTDRMKWWTDARFGMFIHYGVYSLLNRGEWLMYSDKMPFDEYRPLADRFTADEFKPKEWATLARDAGMKYMVLTTRHHDGFCLFDSEVSDFTAPKTAAKRDLIAEYADACHSMGMRMGFYYSFEDWRFPGQLPHLPIKEDRSIYKPMVEQAVAQIREIVTNYGRVDILWFDGNFPYDVWPYQEIDDMVRGLQPGIIINNRAGLPGDFGTPEQNIRAEERPWEACMTISDTWTHVPGDTNLKSVQQIIAMICQCASGAGNLLLNVGPDPEGRIPQALAERLRGVGNWMRVNDRAIRGSERAPLVAQTWGYSTRVGDRLYLLVQRWPGSTLPMAWVGNEIVSATVLADGRKARIEQEGDRVWLHELPQYAPDPDMSVIELEIDGEPRWPDVRFT